MDPKDVGFPAVPMVWSLVVVAAVSALLVAALRRLAERRQVLDHPNRRSSHSQPTPRGGGLAIVVLVAVAGLQVWPSGQFLTAWAAWWTAGLVVAAVSLYDDLHGLASRTRLAVHLLAASAVAATSSFASVEFPFLGSVDLGALGVPVTVIWLVGLTNAYNFMDGIDGIAGGQGVVAGVCVAVAGATVGAGGVAWVGAVIAASCLGFLVHNWSPARIFMGDVGSAFLGFCFGSLACISGLTHGALPFVVACSLWPFLFDAILTFARRLWNGENVFVAHRSHLYQRLVISGLSHGLVSGIYVVLAAVGGALALAWLKGWPAAGYIAAAALPALAIGLWTTVGRCEIQAAAGEQKSHA